MIPIILIANLIGQVNLFPPVKMEQPDFLRFPPITIERCDTLQAFHTQNMFRGRYFLADIAYTSIVSVMNGDSIKLRIPFQEIGGLTEHTNNVAKYLLAYTPVALWKTCNR